MPIYEYVCKKCNNTSEFLVGISQQEELKCRKCGSKELEKIMSRSSVAHNESHGCGSSECLPQRPGPGCPMGGSGCGGCGGGF